MKELKEALEKDALKHIKYDANLDESEYTILVYDRIADDLKEIPYTSITELDDYTFQIKDVEIPYHRIRKILRKGEVVWDKRRI